MKYNTSTENYINCKLTASRDVTTNRNVTTNRYG